MRWPLLAAACALAAIPTLTAGLQQVQERAPKRKALEKKSRNAPKRKALEKKGLRHREKNVRHRHKKALHKAPAVASHGAAGLVDQEGVQQERPAVHRTAAEFEQAVHEADKMLKAMEVAHRANVTQVVAAAGVSEGEQGKKSDGARGEAGAAVGEASEEAQARRAEASDAEAGEVALKETTDVAGTEESSDVAESAKASDQAEAEESAAAARAFDQGTADTAADTAETAEAAGEARAEESSDAAEAEASGKAEAAEASDVSDAAKATDEAGTAETTEASDKAEDSDDKSEAAEATGEAGAEESSDAAETTEESDKAGVGETSDKSDAAETTDEAEISGKSDQELSNKAVLLFEKEADKSKGVDAEAGHEAKAGEEGKAWRAGPAASLSGRSEAHGAAMKVHRADYNYQPKDFQLAGSKSGYLNFIKKYPCTRSPGPDGFPNKFDWIIHRPKDLDDLDGDKDPYAVFSSMEIHTVPAILDFIEQNWPDSKKKRVAYFTGDMMLSRVDKNFGAGTEERLRKAFSGGIWWQAYDVRKPGFKVAPDGLNGMYLMPVWDVAQEAINAASLEDKTKGVLAAWGKFHPNLDANIPARRKLHEWVGTKGSIAAGVEHASFEPREYWSELAKYRFTLSPRGGGIQSPKNDEALLVLTIPISTREGSARGFKTEPAFDDLKKLGWPMVVLDQWSEITKPKLDEWWDELSPRLVSFRKNCLTTEGFWRIVTGQVAYCE
mmetsp:Transcript_122754/g.333388  ORF Transcript_122754/g.333388 Transcript_122754/m.333388 type:complete len:728 (+) Transcript_122754:3-2186(+)